jgi:hypothetical protein
VLRKQCSGFLTIGRMGVLGLTMFPGLLALRRSNDAVSFFALWGVSDLSADATEIGFLWKW